MVDVFDGFRMKCFEEKCDTCGGIPWNASMHGGFFHRLSFSLWTDFNFFACIFSGRFLGAGFHVIVLVFLWVPYAQLFSEFCFIFPSFLMWSGMHTSPKEKRELGVRYGFPGLQLWTSQALINTQNLFC